MGKAKAKQEEKKAPPQERKPNNRGRKPDEVKLRYTDDFYGGKDLSKTPLTDMLLSKLNQVVRVEVDGEVIEAPAKEIVTSNVIALAMDGDKWAIQFLFDRIEGKPVDRIGLGSSSNLKDGLPVTLCEFFYGGAYGQYNNNPKKKG